MTSRIAVFTGTRAEYGLLVPLLRLLSQHKDLDLHLIVSGSHLSKMHGYTIQHIYDDGFVPQANFANVIADDSAEATHKSFALTILDIGAELDRCKPAALVILGDRFEALAAATAAVIHEVPIIHLHGGEISEGADDERFRHAITKLADIHFVAGPEFADRVIQMGENQASVFTCGPAVQDVLASMSTMPRSEIEARLGVSLRRPCGLVVYHPATASDEDPASTMHAILDGALDAGMRRLVVSLPNADRSNAQIADVISKRGSTDERIHLFGSIGQTTYLSTLREVDVIIGNSSSGIIEAPLLETPAVNVGKRQEGRPRASTVIEAAPDRRSIAAAIQQALATETRNQESPYGVGLSMAEGVVNLLAGSDLRLLRKAKRFHDSG